MTKERELLIRALEDWDFSDKVETLDPIFEEIRTYLSTPSDDAEEPVAWMFETDRGPHYFRTEKDALRGASLYGNYVFKPLYLHPPKPAEPEAEPVAWQSLTDEELREIEKEFHAERVRTSDEEYLVIYPADYWDWQRTIEQTLKEKNHPPKPAEPEETIAKLQAENFVLAAGQCTEGGPWSDEGGSQYCKYAARKPMTEAEIIQGVTVDTSDDFHAGYWAGIRFAERHHGIIDADV